MASRKFTLPTMPPLNGLPVEQKISSQQVIASNIYLVRLGNKPFDQDQPIEKLKIQTIPKELGINSVANWAVIPTIGRNNPFYHYTGGEDVVEFTIDWYSVAPLRDDVIRKCKWVESLSRSDGYILPPPHVLLVWGDVFKFDTWIITEATYTLSLFDKEYNMMPRQAYQEIVLKKIVDHNTTIKERRFKHGFTPVPTNYGTIPT